MNRHQIADLKKRCREASCGPWGYNVYPITGSRSSVLEGSITSSSGGSLFSKMESERESLGQLKADAEFIAHAREDVPMLIAEVEKLQSALDDIRMHLDWADSGGSSSQAVQEAMRVIESVTDKPEVVSEEDEGDRFERILA